MDISHHVKLGGCGRYLVIIAFLEGGGDGMHIHVVVSGVTCHSDVVVWFLIVDEVGHIQLE